MPLQERNYWLTTAKLTGLRYDINIPATEAFDRFSMVDPTLANPGAGGIPGAYTYFGTGPGRNGRKRPQEIHYKAFGPRLGFAYSINTKTVLKGRLQSLLPSAQGRTVSQTGYGPGFFNRQTVNVTNGGPTQIDNGITHLFPPSGPFTPDGQNNQNGVITVAAQHRPTLRYPNLESGRSASSNKQPDGERGLCWFRRAPTWWH